MNYKAMEHLARKQQEEMKHPPPDARDALYGTSKRYPDADWNAANGWTAGRLRDYNSLSAGYAANEGFMAD